MMIPWFRSVLACLCLALVGLGLTGCQSSSSQSTEPGPLAAQLSAPTTSTTQAVAATPPAPAAPAASGVTKRTGIFVLRIGDRLTLTFSDFPNPPPPFETAVGEDGKIHLPLLELNKEVVAAGKTKGELEQEIRKLFVPSHFVNMTVAVKLDERYYFVGGEVKQPSQRPYLGEVTVLGAIQSAGDFTDFAKRTKVELIRADGTKLIVDCNKARTDPKKHDLPVFPGDRIIVPRKILF